MMPIICLLQIILFISLIFSFFRYSFSLPTLLEIEIALSGHCHFLLEASLLLFSLRHFQIFRYYLSLFAFILPDDTARHFLIQPC